MNIKKIAVSAIAAVITAVSASAFQVNAAVSTVYGDMNGDGKINIFDELYMKRYLLGQSDDFPITNWRVSADVVQDNVINPNDLIWIHEYIINNKKSVAAPKTPINKFRGIDVSKWQEVIDWKTVAKAGIDFAMIKAGEGTKVEVNFRTNIANAKAAGIQCGVYWFGVAKSVDEAHLEARACLETIAPYQLEYPVAYDFEYRSLTNNPLSGNRSLTTDVLYNFMLDIERAGYYSILYTNKDFPNRYLELSRLTDKFDLWYANTSAVVPDMPCGLWQYSHTGKVDGITPVVDLNYSFRDYLSVMKSNGLNRY